MNKNIITHSDSTNSFNLTQLSTETGNSVFNSLNIVVVEEDKTQEQI